VLGVDGDELGLAGPVVREADHLVARRHPRDAAADLVDHPGKVAALPRRERRRPSLVQQPRADCGLAGVDPGGPDAHDHLSGPGDGTGNVDHPQHVDVAVALEPDGPGHDAPPPPLCGISEEILPVPVHRSHRMAVSTGGVPGGWDGQGGHGGAKVLVLATAALRCSAASPFPWRRAARPRSPRYGAAGRSGPMRLDCAV
jgi:hypothetical protein